MTGYNLDIPGDREDRRKHLDLIAAVVGRMATASAQAKGWSITLAGAAFGVAVLRDSWVLILLGIVGLMAFAKIDAHYLDVEKDFRDLHDAVVANNVTPLAMDPSNVSTRSKNESYKSWSIKWFYGPLVIAGCLLLIYSLCYGRVEDQSAKEQTVKVTVTVTPFLQLLRQLTPRRRPCLALCRPPRIPHRLLQRRQLHRRWRVHTSDCS